MYNVSPPSPSFQLLQLKASRPVQLKLSVYLVHLPKSDGDVILHDVERRQQKSPWRFHQNRNGRDPPAKPELITVMAKSTLDGTTC